MEQRIAFISYVEEDGVLVKALAQELRDLGHTTWVYEEDGLGGISYLEQTLGAIDGCQFFILVASERSVRSRQVIREVEHAHEAEKLIIPVRVGLTHQQFVASSAILSMACGTAVTLAASNAPSVLAAQIARTFRSAGAVRESPERQETKPPAGGADRTVERAENKAAISQATQEGRQKGQASSHIFVSYRPEDAEGHILLLHRLRERFGKHGVFKRAGNIEPGQDVAQVITEARAGSVLLVVIGREWLTIKDASSHRRLDDPNDSVRLEVAAALKNDEVRVIPVLVGGARMPIRDDLPSDLRHLHDRQAVELREWRWNEDFVSLVRTLEACGL